jgi:fibronectin type 3 domain-containing protein
VVSVDTSKNLAASAAFPGYLTDTMPPAAPVGVAGSIDSMGIVKLHWAAGREADLKGYKVYFAYGDSDQFEQLTHTVLTDTVFTDTISTKSLNRRVWYSVVAVDSTNNHSRYSMPLVLKKVKVVPPSAPVAGTVSVDGRRVSIEWIQSRSEGASGYEVARQRGDGGYVPVGQLAQDWKKRSLVFADTVAANTEYHYMARTIDSTGVKSDWSVAVHVVRHAADSLAGPVGLQATLQGKQRHVKLSWKYADTGDYFFIVYRSVNNSGLVAWQSFDKAASAGEDDEAASGAYDYAIKVVHRDRSAASALSKPIHITIP